MAKRKNTAPESATSPAPASSSSSSKAEPKLRLITLTRPRVVAVENWDGEIPDDGVVEHKGKRCFVDQVR